MAILFIAVQIVVEVTIEQPAGNIGNFDVYYLHKASTVSDRKMTDQFMLKTAQKSLAL